MIEITNAEVFGKVIADALTSVGENASLQTLEAKRCVNAIAKAAARIESSGCYMDYNADEDRLLLWSDSNEIYELKADGRCQCIAQSHGVICWHKAAKRLIERYNEAMMHLFSADAEFRRAEYSAGR